MWSYAVRRNRKEGLLKRLAYAGFYRLWKLTSDVPPPADSGDFCVMDRRVVEVINKLPERNRFLRGLRAFVGFRQVGVEYDRDARRAGVSKYTLEKLVRLASDGLFSFGAAPLRLASAAGVAFCLAAFFLAAFVVAWKLTDVSILGMKPSNAAGWTSLAAVILFSAGVQMLLLGVIGEYLARIFEEVKGRPGWIVAEEFGGGLHHGNPHATRPEFRFMEVDSSIGNPLNEPESSEFSGKRHLTLEGTSRRHNMFVLPSHGW